MATVQAPPPLDPLRTKLVTLIDQIQYLHSHLLHLSTSTQLPTSTNPGILSFNELLSRYNILLSGIVGLGSLLSDLGIREKERKRKEVERVGWRDLKKEKYQGAVVVPAMVVEEGKDWIVGMLLRTKQTPEVEKHLEALQTELPPQFQSNYEKELEQYQKLTQSAEIKIRKIITELDGEEFDWKARIDGFQEDEEDEEGGGDDIDMVPVEKIVKQVEPMGKSWSLAELSIYQKSGVLPS